MFDSSELSKELHALQADVSRLFETAREGIRDTSRTHAETLADQIKAALNELGETLSEQEEQVAHFVSDRPVTSLASAFALGIVVGFMMRKH